MATSTPRDRFDDIPTDLERVGAHRVPRRPHRGWISFAWAALATGVLVGAGVIGLLAINSNIAFDGVFGATATPSAEATDGGATAPTDTATTEAPVVPEETPGPVATIDPALDVTVLNGTVTVGLAGRVGETLGTAGWTVALVDNAPTEDITVTTVYYSDPADAGAALGLANSLGLATIAESQEYVDSGADLVAVIGSDYVEPAAPTDEE